MTLTGLITKNNHTALFLVNYCILLYQGSARVPENFGSPRPSPGFFDTSRSQSRIPDFSVPEISVPDPANYEFESWSQFGVWTNIRIDTLDAKSFRYPNSHKIPKKSHIPKQLPFFVSQKCDYLEALQYQDRYLRFEILQVPKSLKSNQIVTNTLIVTHFMVSRKALQ